MERITNSDKLEILANSEDIEKTRRYLGHLGLVDALAEPMPPSPEHDDDDRWIERGRE